MDSISQYDLLVNGQRVGDKPSRIRITVDRCESTLLACRGKAVLCQCLGCRAFSTGKVLEEV